LTDYHYDVDDDVSPLSVSNPCGSFNSRLEYYHFFAFQGGDRVDPPLSTTSCTYTLAGNVERIITERERPSVVSDPSQHRAESPFPSRRRKPAVRFFEPRQQGAVAVAPVSNRYRCHPRAAKSHRQRASECHDLTPKGSRIVATGGVSARAETQHVDRCPAHLSPSPPERGQGAERD
jgi:hypothetical protein